MLKKIFEIIPAQSLIFFSICVASILVFIVLIIVPSQKTAAELDTRIEELEKRNAEQSALTPVFYTLLAKAKAKNASQLPTTEKKKLARGDMKKISTQILEQIHNTYSELGEVLGLFQQKRKEEFGHKIVDDLVQLLFDLRNELRKKKEYGLSDEIRSRMKQLGLIIEDTKEGPKWRLIQRKSMTQL